ncbi:MAG: hypothetical protein J6S85_11520 [Methanobrevibacter sp.]|nr:hypothetical protein [Methanobrevibacter sp.]
MFEKEAFNYGMIYAKTTLLNTNGELEQAFKDGAEFGYNKANEWHYVKDELPPIKKEYNGRSELVLVLSKEKEMQYAQYVEKEKTWARGICEISFVPYAWKEIVLPKESE